MPRQTLLFDGHIAGFGTSTGTRLVVGRWRESPFGPFTDVMVEQTDGHRVLLAPSEAVADFVSSTYTFDEVVVVPVASAITHWGRRRAMLNVTAGPLVAAVTVGRVSALGALLRLVPRDLATNTAWLRLINPIARVLVPGARTAGSAGKGRTEFYGVRSARAITSIAATWDGDDLGHLTRLYPAVRFGFGSAPAAPHLVSIVTTIHEP